MKTWIKEEVFTYITLFVLLTIRIPIADIAINLGRLIGISADSFWVGNLRVIQEVTYYLYNGWSFILVGFIIVINIGELDSLNIDKYFIGIFIASGLTYWTYYRLPSGWIALIMSITIFILYRRLGRKTVKTEPAAGKIVILIILAFSLGLLFVGNSLNITKILSAIHSTATRLPFVIIEEMIFRGLLWKFLRNLNWSAPKIVGLQALLFWISHTYDMFANPVLFWIIIPIAGILLGIIVWQSRSITVSTFAHIFYNLLSMFF